MSELLTLTYLPKLRRLAGIPREPLCFARFASSQRNQYKINNIKYAVSIIALTPATESTKASLASL